MSSLIKSRHLLIIMMIVGTWLLAVFILRTFGVSQIHQAGNPEINPVQKGTIYVQGAVKWDGLYFFQIAKEGYGQHISPKIAFYPLFPLITKTIADFLNRDIISVGLVINLLASFAATVFLCLLAQDYFRQNKTKSVNVVLLFLFFPTSFFLLSFYSEALVCALGFGACYFARKRNWPFATVLASLASATRITGLLFGLAVVIEYFDAIHFKLRKIRLNALWLLLVPTGFLIYVLFLWRRFGDPWLFRNIYLHAWSYQKFQPNILITLWSEFKNAIELLLNWPHSWADEWVGNVLLKFMFLGSWLFLLIISIVSTIKKYLPISYLVLLYSGLILFALNSNFVSVNRYILPLFPIYLVLARLSSKKEWLFPLLLATSALAMGVLLVLFSNGYWVG